MSKKKKVEPDDDQEVAISALEDLPLSGAEEAIGHFIAKEGINPGPFLEHVKKHADDLEAQYAEEREEEGGDDDEPDTDSGEPTNEGDKDGD